MPATTSLQDADPAELVLERLLKPWPVAVETPAIPRRPFVFAFLPSASHVMVRPQNIRPAPRAVEPNGPRSGVRASRRPEDRGAQERAGLERLSFELVAATLSTLRWADDDTRESEAIDDAAERATSPDATDLRDAGFDDHRFAARVVALKAAGALDPSVLAGFGSAAPTLCAEVYRSIDDPDDDPIHRAAQAAGSPVATASTTPRTSLAASLFSADGEEGVEPASRSIFL